MQRSLQFQRLFILMGTIPRCFFKVHCMSLNRGIDSRYVTIEPCIMCASAIAQLGIKRAVFGASNDRFGGCGSVLSLNLDKGKVVYEVTRGVFQDKTIHLLQCFYDRENQYAPDEKRRRKNKGLLVCSLIIIRVYLKPTRQFIH